MLLKDILNKLFREASLKITVENCEGDVCLVDLDDQPKEMSLPDLLALSNRLFAEKYSSTSRIQARLFTERAPNRFEIDLDPNREGPEKIVFKQGNDWVLSEIGLVIPVTDNASSDCRRPMAAGFSLAEKSFVVWSGPNMNPYVAECDVTTQQCITKDLGPIDPHRDGYYDFHDYSHLVRAKDGHLIVVYSNHNRRLWQLRSPQSDSIDGEWKKTEIAGADGKAIRATYPMPIVTNDGTLYIFYRKTGSVSDDRPIEYVKSTNNGITWTEPQPAIDFQNAREDHLNEIYIGRMIHDGTTDKILISWTLAGGGPREHAHDVYHKDVYFSYFDPVTGRFSSVSGKDLGPFIENEEAGKHCLVYDSGSLDQKIKQQIDYKPLIQSDPRTGKPLVMFYDNVKDQAILSRWDGAVWKTTGLDFSAKELVATLEGNLRAFATIKNGIKIYESVNGGISWEVARTIRTPHKLNQLISIGDQGNRLLGQNTTKVEEETDATAGGSSVYQIVLP